MVFKTIDQVIGETPPVLVGNTFPTSSPAVVLGEYVPGLAANTFSGNVGNDTFVLNITADIGANTAGVTGLLIEGNAPTGTDAPLALPKRVRPELSPSASLDPAPARTHPHRFVRQRQHPPARHRP